MGRHLLAVLRADLVAVACAVLAGCGTSGARTDTLPPFALTNQSGATVSAESLRGYATVVTFIYTSCRDVCPLLTAQLVRLQALAREDGLGPRLRFVSVTVDPATDTPAVLARYATGYGADLSTWHFLTGSADDIRRLVEAVGVLTGSRGRVGHTNLVLFIDRRGRIAEQSTDIDLDPSRLLPTLRRLAA